MGPSAVGFNDGGRQSTVVLWRRRHRLPVWRLGCGRHRIHVCVEGAPHHCVFCVAYCRALPRGHHEVDHPDHWGWTSTLSRHFSGGIHECHSEHFCGTNRGPPGGQAVHCDHDPVGALCRNGWGVGVRRGFSLGRLRVDWGACRVLDCGLLHVRAGRIDVCQNADSRNGGASNGIARRRR